MIRANSALAAPGASTAWRRETISRSDMDQPSFAAATNCAVLPTEPMAGAIMVMK